MIPIEKEKLLISPKNIKPSSNLFEVIGTINPGAERLPNGDIVLYVRVIEKLKKTEDKNYFYVPRFSGKNKFKISLDKFNKSATISNSDLDIVFKDGTKRLTFISHLRRVVLDKSGFNIKSIDRKPSFFGIESDGELGIEDPRIVKLDGLYYMTYVSLSREGNISSSYAISNDLKKWDRKGISFKEQDKDVVLFSEKINGKYYAFHRPEGNFEFSPPHIWISSSKNINYLGKPTPIKIANRGSWDYTRAGSGCPPIKLDKGWLLIYHGVIDKKRKKHIDMIHKMISKIFHVKLIETTIRSKYCVGAAMFDLKNPSKLISKSPLPLIYPRQKYEQGTFEDKDVVFPTGIVRDLNKDNLLIYSGGGDIVTTVKKVKLSNIFNSLKKVNLR